MCIVVLAMTPFAALASQCKFIADKSVCGVSLDASPKQFFDSMGKPDGQLRMGQSRIGYFFGPHLLLIFQREKLLEVHAWESNPNIDFWDYVGGGSKSTDVRLVFDGWSPWGLTRKAMKKHDSEIPQADADERVEGRMIGHAGLTIFYDCYGVQAECTGDWETMQVTHISIRVRPENAEQSVATDRSGGG